MEIRRVGVDLAKNVFQVHGVDQREAGVAASTEAIPVTVCDSEARPTIC